MDNIYPAVLKKEYVKTADTIALGLLLNLCLLQMRTQLDGIFTKMFISLGIADASVTLANCRCLVNIILYMLSFLLPAFFVSRFLNNEFSQKQRKNIVFSCRFPRYFYLLLPAALGCIAISGRVTEILQKILGNARIGFIGSAPTLPDDVIGILLVFVSSAVIPAVVEEILFRKVVLSHLTPYGKWFAIVMSSLFFAFMHSNPSQILYAFVGGLVMGFVTLKCGSVLPAVIIHFSNNTLSLVYLLIKKYAEEKTFTFIVLFIDTVLSVMGIIAVAIFIYKKKYILEERKTEGFSPFKESLRLYLLAYLAYSVYLCSRWVYII